MRWRKAVSPLIATVLLIAFAVALAAVILSWASPNTRVGGQIASKECKDVALIIEELDGEPHICSTIADKKVVEILVTNVGTKEISSLTLNIISDEGNTWNNPVQESILPSNTRKVVHFFIGDLKRISKVRITPSTMSGDQEIICPLSFVEATNIKEC